MSLEAPPPRIGILTEFVGGFIEESNPIDLPNDSNSDLVLIAT